MSYLILIAGAFTFLASDVSWMIGIGAILAIFLLDRALRRHEADRPLASLPEANMFNIAPSVTPRAFSLVERAYDRSIMLHRDVLLELVLQLALLPEIKAALRRADVSPDEFRAKAEEFARSDQQILTFKEQDRLNIVEHVMTRAARIVLAARRSVIEAKDIFRAVCEPTYGLTDRLITAFGLMSETEEAVEFEEGHAVTQE